MIGKAGLGLSIGLIVIASGLPPASAPAAAREAGNLCPTTPDSSSGDVKPCVSAADAADCPGEKKNFATGGCVCAPSGICPDTF
jgi:hypothetical protein